MEERVLVWALGRDGPLTCGFLGEAGFTCKVCRSWEAIRAEAAAGVGVLVAAGELLTADTLPDLEGWLSLQPPWSDLPVVVIDKMEWTSAANGVFAELGNVSVLHRPVSPDTLTATVRTAIRARRRQYQVRDLLRQREESERRKDEFLAMLAHELRNPLAPIRTGLQLLRLMPTGEKAERTRGMMERQVGNLIRLIDDLLDVSRLTRGRITLQKHRLDLGELVGQASDSFARQAAEKGLELEVTPPSESLMVQADPTRVEQMIGNVVGNAIKFTPNNGKISIAAACEAGQAVIRVRDTGVGIPPEQLGQVFELFSQTQRTLDRSAGGLGIGLTVVRALAELHGGSAEIYSAGEGQGTEVVIRLPAEKTWDAGEEPANEAEQLAFQRKRVLVIEDNPDAAGTQAMFLRAIGHIVSVAKDGPAGLAAARRQRPDVVLCDIGLPGIDGYEVVRILRGEPEFQGCLFIAVTGYGDAVDRKRSREAGFAHHLTKPADPQQIAVLIARAGLSSTDHPTSTGRTDAGSH